MGTDDLHKRKAKKASELARRKARRKPYAKVLIVCEGKKTEPNYFNDLIDCYRLNSANVEVYGHGADPLKIFDYAKQRYKEEKNAGDPFDNVYCVFDKDAHANYRPGIEAIRSATPKKVYIAITSVPCFEYWLLLHFTYTTKPYNALSGNSACNQVLTNLKIHMNYEKGGKKIFSQLIDRLNYAKGNAACALKEAEEGNTDNPTTHMHELVEFLQNIKHS